MTGERPSWNEDTAARRPERPRRRRRGVPLPLVLVLVGLALAGGVLVGYRVRGEPPPAGLVTEERAVPVVTVTVEAP